MRKTCRHLRQLAGLIRSDSLLEAHSYHIRGRAHSWVRLRHVTDGAASHSTRRAKYTREVAGYGVSQPIAGTAASGTAFLSQSAQIDLSHSQFILFAAGDPTRKRLTASVRVRVSAQITCLILIAILFADGDPSRTRRASPHRVVIAIPASGAPALPSAVNPLR